MDRRQKLILLIVVAALLLAFGIWYLVSPFIKTAQQPPTPSNGTPTTNVVPSKPKPTTPTVTAPIVSQDVKKLQDLATNVVNRIGSGTSAEGFRGYQDAMLNATLDLQKQLATQQQQMQTAHPATGPAYGVVTRVVSSDSRSAVFGSPSLTITLKAQQAVDAAGQTTAVLYKQITVTFAKQSDGTYLVSDIVWNDYQR